VQVQQWGFTVEDKHFIKELTAIKKINAVKNFNAGKNYANQQCQQ